MTMTLSPNGAPAAGWFRGIFGRVEANARNLRGMARTGRLALVVFASIGAIMAARAGSEGDTPSGVPSQATLQRHVGLLASPEFAGRSGAGGRKAADYVIEHFRRLGLEPLFSDSFEQPIQGFGAPAGAVIGRNVGAVLRGSDPKLRDEWVIVSAHYDHLGNHEALYPGADDNASGVAMLLEVARCFASMEGAKRPRRSVAFVGFDLEERGLWGSTYFAEHPPFPLDGLKLFITADMIGRSLGGVCDEYVFVMGTEHAPDLRPCVDRAGSGLALTVGVVGSDLLLFDRSDYGPFRKRKIPYLFFSTGESDVYHTPEDRPETLDYPKLAEISTLIERVVEQAVSSDELPGWEAKPSHLLGEAIAVRAVLTRLLDQGAKLRVKPLQAGWLKSQIRDLDDAIQRGVLTPVERQRMLLNAQMVLYSVL